MAGKYESPLRWPDNYARTRIQDRKPQSSWKKRLPEQVTLLETELGRLRATDWLITYDADGRDPGVAVWLSLKPLDQYGWQEALGFVGKIPAVAQIEAAYKTLAMKCHPDRGGDPAEFAALTRHRDRAIAWARGTEKIEHEKVIAIDAFNEIRLNLNAIRLVIHAMRQIERCGAPLMVERAWRGFHKQLTAEASRDATAVA